MATCLRRSSIDGIWIDGRCLKIMMSGSNESLRFGYMSESEAERAFNELIEWIENGNTTLINVP